MSTKRVETLKRYWQTYVDGIPVDTEFIDNKIGLRYTTLSQCCGAAFISGLTGPNRKAYILFQKKHDEDRNRPDIYALSAEELADLEAYVIAKAMQFIAKAFQRTSDRPFLSCISASYQTEAIKGLRKAGWKPSQEVYGNGAAKLIMWTKDARLWRHLK